MWKDFDVLTGIKTLENDLSLERNNKKIILIAGLMATLLWSAVTGHPLSAPGMASAQSTCGSLPSSATASANDGNVPQNAIDNDLSTRWSNFGKGSWIQLDLGTTKVVCSVDIAWFNGNQRQSFFVISVSTDGTTFTNVYPNGQSSGTSLNPQPYDFVDTNARYVRITVNGNSQNDWASITEIAVKGYTPTIPPDTTPPSQVTGLGATPTSSSQINLSWTANPAGDGVNHYNVYRGTTAGFTPITPIAQPTTTSYSNTGLTASTTYYYKVAAVDAAGNVGAPSSAVSGTTSSSTPLPDTTPPSQVTGLGATPTSSSQINLSWTANPAGDGVNHYNVYRGTTAGFTPITPIAQPTTTSYSNTGLTASTTYYYKVAAVDAAGNVGAPSSAVSGTTQSSSPPSTCGSLPSSATASANDGNVPQNAIDNDLSTRWSNFGKGSWIQLDLGTTKVVCSVDIAWFNGNQRQSFFVISVSTDGTTFTNVYPNGQSSGTSLNPQPYDFVDTNARYVRITVNGNSQNDWASITEIAVKGYTPTIPPDTTPPSQVTGLGATPTSSSQINLSWTANPAGDGVNHYNVYRGTTAGFTPITPIAQPTTTSYSNTGLTASTTYYYKVAAVDAAGNVGAPSSAVSGTTSSSTPLPDTTPPSQVTGLGATPTSSSQINLSWTANPAGDGVNHYNVYRGTTAGFTPITPIAQPTTTSYSNTGLTASTTYYYKVAAVDAAGNVGAPSSAVSGTTSSSTPLPDTTPPSQVTGLGATPTSSSQINLSWTANPAGDGVNHYNVYRGTTAGFTPITPIAQPTTTSYSNTGLTASTTYYYKVAAVDAAGNVGAPSSAVSGTTQSSSGPGSDIFGIKKIYSTKSGGEEWYVNMQEPTQDPRFDPQSTITKNADGSWKITSTQVRMSVFTSTGYDQNKIPTYDEKQLASKGYMQAANDWKNIEMTGYVRANSFSTDDNFAWYNRGGKHTDSAPCEGTAYKGDVYYSGKTRFAKEQWHVSYVFTSTDTATSSIKAKWVGFKFIVFNFVQPDGKTAVKMENWLDINNDGTWTKVDENIDSGGWGTEGTECNGSADQIISWGGPITTFRWDSATNTDFKNLSVREIQPP